MIETNVPANTVDVYVSTLTPQIEQLIKTRYGVDRVRVFTSGEPVPDATVNCSRTTCNAPWRGGLKIARSDGQGICTSGFVVRKLAAGGGYNYAIWTAGHCSYDGDKKDQWRRGSSTGPIIGTTSANFFVDDSAADVQVIPISETNKTNTIIDDTASCNPCNIRTFIGAAQQTKDGDEFGDTVCNNGFKTGKSCGTIRSTDVGIFTYLGTDLIHQRRATYNRDGGDSGGPIFTTKGSVAAGSHVHYVLIAGDDNPIYTHVWEMSSATGYSVYNGT